MNTNTILHMLQRSEAMHVDNNTLVTNILKQVHLYVDLRLINKATTLMIKVVVVVKKMQYAPVFVEYARNLRSFMIVLICSCLQ